MTLSVSGSRFWPYKSAGVAGAPRNMPSNSSPSPIFGPTGCLPDLLAEPFTRVNRIQIMEEFKIFPNHYPWTGSMYLTGDKRLSITNGSPLYACSKNIWMNGVSIHFAYHAEGEMDGNAIPLAPDPCN